MKGMSNHIYDHVSEFLAGLEHDDDTAAQVRKAVSDTFGAAAAVPAHDVEGRFQVVEYRIVGLFETAHYRSFEAVAVMPIAQLAHQFGDGNALLHTFDTVSVTAVGDDTISALAVEAGSDPAWFLGTEEDDRS